MHLALLLISLTAGQAEVPTQSPTPEQVEVLKRFREEFVVLRPGQDPYPAKQQIGSEEFPASRPVRTIRLSKPLAIAKYEVTQELYEAVTGGNPSRWKGPRNSVEMVSHSEAVAFCEKVTTLLRQAKLIGEKQKIRLPSEAEWEYAARAGTDTRYSFGDDPDKLGDYAWYTENAAGNDPPVGAKKPNPWGLYDMHGYLWQWCADPWHPTHEGAPETVAPRDPPEEQTTPPQFVARGGSWKSPAAECASAYRIGLPADTRDAALGLRCVLDPAE